MRSFVAFGLISLGSGMILEKVTELPLGWEKVADGLDPSQPLRLSFALREPNMDQLPDIIMAASKHLSAQEAQELRAPDQDDVDAVQKWLAANGITDAVQQDGWIKIHTTVEQAQQLLDMELGKFAFEDQDPVMRTTEYSIPDDLMDAISFVHPVANFMPPRKDLSQPSEEVNDDAMSLDRRAGEPCGRKTSPSCIRQMYNFPPVEPGAESSVRVGIAGFLEEYANYVDTQLFLMSLAPDIAATGYNFDVELVNGGENPQDPRQAGGEAALDMQYAMSLGYPAQMTYYSTGGRGVKLDDKGKPYAEEFVDNEPYLEFLEYLLAKPDDEIPHVLSFSYADDELSVPRPYAIRVCALFGLLAARGTTVLGGSGDGGAKGARNSTCRTPEGDDVTMAVFPASCPWVTGVGATRNQGDPPPGAGLSGGGFSQYFVKQPWQSEVVDEYVNQLGGHLEGYYDPNMRATPDIAAIGTTFQVVVNRKTQLLDGTSASTPLLAAMIGLINDARLKAGKPVLGWLNRYLYSEPVRSALQDTTKGVSYSCTFSDGSSPGGWPAKKGWDAITGLGVPDDFQAFKDALLAV